MRDALELLQKFGVGLVAIVVVVLASIVAAKAFWPLVKSRWELADKVLLENAEHNKRMLEETIKANAEHNRRMLETTMKEFGDQLRESHRVSERIVTHLESLTDEVRRTSRKRV